MSSKEPTNPAGQTPTGDSFSLTPGEVTLLRSDDLVNLKFSFSNLTIDAVTNTLRPSSAKGGFITIEFPPQSLVEEVVAESEFKGIPSLKPARCRVAGPSRLVFRVSEGTHIPFTPEGLLDWTKLGLLVQGLVKSGDPTPPPTSIEAPYGLLVSPQLGAGWTHSIRPVTVNDRTELWHTRLVKGTASHLTLHPYAFVEGGGPEFSPLTESNREQIVEQLFDKPPAEQIKVERLMLSSLGAWMDVRAQWKVKLGDKDVEESWQHRATMGRDHYVRVVRAGYLFPFGHRAVKVEVTERKFKKFSPNGGPARVGAWLAKRVYIVVLEQEKDYAATAATSVGRQLPFKRVRIATTVTPDLDLPGPGAEDLFLITVGGTAFPFPVTAADSDGHLSDFTAPLVFVVANKATNVKDLQGKYKNHSTVEMPGGKVTYAAGDNDKSGVTAYETSQVIFKGVGAPGLSPPFHPAVDKAIVRIPAVEQFAAQSSTVEIAYAQSYVKNGFSATANAGQVFAQLAQSLSVAFPGDKSGGLVKPDMEINALSRTTGATPASAEPNFNPQNIFSGAKILGGISLGSILPSSLPANKSPRLLTQTIYKGNNPANGVEAVETKLSWSLSGNEIVTSGPFLKVEGENVTTNLLIESKVTARPDGKDPDYFVHGELKNFGISLAGIIKIQFKELTFDAAKDKKLDFSAALKTPAVAFEGALSFLNALADALNKFPQGFEDPPFLDLSPAGVTAGFTQGLPPLTIGVVALDNLSFTAALSLPFNGSDPVRARFAFCERHDPFHILVYGVGGGGFLGVAVGLDGVEMIEASLEFGGSLVLNLGIAAGAAYVMAGIYFKVELKKKEADKPPADEVAVTGYLRCGGELEVLGLICISAEFYMGLTYEVDAKKIWGQAKLTVEVEVAFFSESVELEVRREFTNSAKFTFEDIMPPVKDAKTGLTPWEEYCEAFAA